MLLVIQNHGLCHREVVLCSTIFLFPFGDFRVVYIFGPPIRDSPRDVTATFLTPNVLSTLKQADHLARKTLMDSGM